MPTRRQTAIHEAAHAVYAIQHENPCELLALGNIGNRVRTHGYCTVAHDWGINILEDRPDPSSQVWAIAAVRLYAEQCLAGTDNHVQSDAVTSYRYSSPDLIGERTWLICPAGTTPFSLNWPAIPPRSRLAYQASSQTALTTQSTTNSVTAVGMIRITPESSHWINLPRLSLYSRSLIQ